MSLLSHQVDDILHIIVKIFLRHDRTLTIPTTVNNKQTIALSQFILLGPIQLRISSVVPMNQEHRVSIAQRPHKGRRRGFCHRKILSFIICFSPFHLCPLTDFYFSLSHCEASVSQDQGKYEASLAEPRYEDED